MTCDPSRASGARDLSLVECDVAMRQKGAGLGGSWSVPVSALLRWDPADPWAVVLDFAAGPSWALGWELLAEASRAPAWRGWVGVGDVRWRRVLPEELRLNLRGPAAEATLRVDAWDVCAFVESVAARLVSAVSVWRTGLDDADWAL